MSGKTQTTNSARAQAQSAPAQQAAAQQAVVQQAVVQQVSAQQAVAKPASAQQPTTAKTAASPQKQATASSGGLSQTLTLPDLVFFGLVMLVPISPFAIYGNVFQVSDGQPGLAYLVAFLCIIPSAVCFSVMIKKWQSSGSVFAFCYNSLGPAFGYVGGWMMLLQYFVYPALMYILAGTALHQFVPQVPILAWSFIILAVVTVISLMGMQATVTVNRVALVAELIVLGMFFFFALRHIFFGTPLDTQAAANVAKTTQGFNIGAVMAAVALCMLSYIGFGTVATLTQESKRPATDPSRAVIITTIIVGVIFISTNFVAQAIDPSGSLFANNSGNGFYLVAAAVGGEWFGNLCAISLALAMGLFSGLAGVISISRVVYVMAKAGGLPHVFGVLDKKTHAPRRAMYLMAIVSVALLLLLIPIGSDNATDINNFAAMFTYALVDICVVWYCWIKRNDRANVWTRLIIPAFGALVLIAVMASASPIAMIVGCIWCVIGIGVYLLLTRVMHRTIDLGS